MSENLMNKWGIIVTTVNELINKSYYQTIMDKHEKKHPINILGEMYMEEMEKQWPDISSIRYAQGEVYFLNKDYEAAIYKWGNPLEDPFIPWAQKNIADAHLEMGLLEEAEKFYKEVETQSVELKAEVLLQLFSLYIQQGKHENAVDAIKNAVQIAPDYSDVTKVAQTFFENYKDWENAVELAVNEAIRTKSYSWFEVLQGYAEQGHILNDEPSYFSEVLTTLLAIDMYRFESLTEVLWNRYKPSEFYIQWLEKINQIILNNNVEESYMWKKLPNLFKTSYFELISGSFLIRDISELIQNHLKNWLKISSVSDTLISSTAILAWDEVFQSDLDATLVNEAAYLFENSNANPNGIQEGMNLFESIQAWAEKEGLLDDLSEFMKPMIEDYNLEVASPSKIRSINKTSIEFLIEKRVEVEHGINEKMNWNEEFLARLNGLHHQLRDMEQEEANVMKASFSQMKLEFTQNMTNKLTKLLQDCSKIVREDSDFRKLHIEINDEMNRQIANYMENTALHDFKNAIQSWLEDCEREFKDCQINFDEMSESFNQQYGEEKIVLDGDFKILDDWQRDLERISRGMVRIEKANIMLRNNPSQLLLKGAGRLLGSISKSKEKLHVSYKNYIENEDYSQNILELTNPLRQQLDLFERSIEWDVSKFFSSSLDVLTSVSEEVHGDIEKHKHFLDVMREKPEIYRDPLTLFELRLRQYELINGMD
ncbi:tetratricopeptide repeat protein [Virgibacillus byunsanensis]|uniref:Tetratricopeptide repeat protein n=1 Tax=Virgibacillus byunsanensis TaxID=570945 RepID=A0ABW3LSE9_9BACI